MTRKDYVLIAAAIRATQERIKAQFEERRDNSLEIQAQQSWDRDNQLRGVRRTAAHLCDALARDNPHFDPTTFLKACGYGGTSMNPSDPALDLRPL